MTRPGQGLPKHACGPFPSGYSVPELDRSAKLNDKDTSFYQSQISVLRWCVELGQIDIITEVLTLSSQPPSIAMTGTFGCIVPSVCYNARIVYDPMYLDIDRVFKQCHWKQCYGEVKEAIPPNAPAPKGKDVDLHMLVDSEHADDKLM
jgi:hypothetical protein